MKYRVYGDKARIILTEGRLLKNKEFGQKLR